VTPRAHPLSHTSLSLPSLSHPRAQASTRPYLLPFLQRVGTSGSGARISSLDANSYVLEHAAGLAAAVIAVDAGADPHATSSLLAWVMTHIRLYGSSVPKQVKVTEVAVSALMTLLRSDTVRGLFVEERGLERLVPLCASRNSQLLYEAGFCLWSLSLTGEYCPLLERAGAVTAVARLLRSGMPLKVLRVAAATLANVAKAPDCADSVAEICETHVPEVVAALLAGAGGGKGDKGAASADGGDASAAASDPELVRAVWWCARPAEGWDGGGRRSPPPQRRSSSFRPLLSHPSYRASPLPTPSLLPRPQLDDLRWLADAIASNKRRLTSLERYEKELASGRLEWTAVHGPEFWGANALAAEAGDFRLVKALGALVADPSTDALTLAVALSDLGEFAVAHPQGRTVLASLGIRPAVMACLKRDEEEVKQQALLACSKLLVNKWQFVTSGGSGGGSGTPKA
jgi:hypothetical protein